jgi:hypothetical protein
VIWGLLANRLGILGQGSGDGAEQMRGSCASALKEINYLRVVKSKIV